VDTVVLYGSEAKCQQETAVADMVHDKGFATDG
jgi:hypothetical protein